MNTNMNLIDTHCHLADRRLRRNIDQVIHDAASAGVNTMISATANIADARVAADIASEHAEVFCTAGVHPHHAADAASISPREGSQGATRTAVACATSHAAVHGRV